MPMAAREMDVTAMQGMLIVPSSTVRIGGVSAATFGDLCLGEIQGTIVSGSPTVLIDFKPAARVQDLVVGVHVPTGAGVTVPITFGDPLVLFDG